MITKAQSIIDAAAQGAAVRALQSKTKDAKKKPKAGGVVTGVASALAPVAPDEIEALAQAVQASFKRDNGAANPAEQAIGRNWETDVDGMEIRLPELLPIRTLNAGGHEVGLSAGLHVLPSKPKAGKTLATVALTAELLASSVPVSYFAVFERRAPSTSTVLSAEVKARTAGSAARLPFTNVTSFFDDFDAFVKQIPDSVALPVIIFDSLTLGAKLASTPARALRFAAQSGGVEVADLEVMFNLNQKATQAGVIVIATINIEAMPITKAFDGLLEGLVRIHYSGDLVDGLIFDNVATSRSAVTYKFQPASIDEAVKALGYMARSK